MTSKYNVIWYLEKMIELLCVSPYEKQFQSYLVYPILEEIINKKKKFIDIELIDCHNFKKENTKTHTRCKYSILSKAVPDLLLASNFFYNNRDEETYNYMHPIASVEVKEPNNDEMLNRCVNSNKDKSKEEYKDQLYVQLLPSLIKNKKVILTNLRKWEFFDNSFINKENLDSEIKKIKEDIRIYVEILEICSFDSFTDYNSGKLEEVIKSKKRSLEEIIKNHTGKKELLNSLVNKENEKIVKSDFNKIIGLVEHVDKDQIKEYIKLSHTKTIEILKPKNNEIEKRLVVYGSDFDQITKLDDNQYISGVHDIEYDTDGFDNLKRELKNFI